MRVCVCMDVYLHVGSYCAAHMRMCCRAGQVHQAPKVCEGKLALLVSQGRKDVEDDRDLLVYK